MKLIYVDDEGPARDNFRLTAAGIREVEQLELFQCGEDALKWLEENKADAAFMDMEMPGLTGLALAEKVQALCPGMHIVFVTAFSQYALDAWGTDAVGYVMKPYVQADIEKEIRKIRKLRKVPSRYEDKRVVIQTIPSFSISVEGKAIIFSREKVRELMALLADRGESGLTSGEGIACLWPDRSNDANSQALFRVTYKRLSDALMSEGVGDIITSKENRRMILVEKVECDLYKILSGDEQEAKKYDGQYLNEYSWAEDRNGQLHRMLLENR